MNEMSDTSVAQLETPVSLSRADLTEAVRATALLADVSVKTWSGQATDKKLSNQIKVDAGAVGDTGRYVKKLLAGCDTKLKVVVAAYVACRTTHYHLTLPWVSQPNAERQTGARLLPNMLFQKYLDEMGRLKKHAMNTLDGFILDYPGLVVQAQANLAALANPDDYPTPEQVRECFDIRFDFQPIPSAGAFQGLPDAMLEKLGAQLTRRQEQAVRASQAYMWGRVRDSVAHLVDRLDDPDTTFKHTSVEKVRELVELMPGWNCTGDDRVTTVVSDIDRMLSGITVKDLRESTTARADVVAQARNIVSKMEQWGL